MKDQDWDREEKSPVPFTLLGQDKEGSISTLGVAKGGDSLKGIEISAYGEMGNFICFCTDKLPKNWTQSGAAGSEIPSFGDGYTLRIKPKYRPSWYDKTFFALSKETGRIYDLKAAYDKLEIEIWGLTYANDKLALLYGKENIYRMKETLEGLDFKSILSKDVAERIWGREHFDKWGNSIIGSNDILTPEGEIVHLDAGKKQIEFQEFYQSFYIYDGSNQ